MVPKAELVLSVDPKSPSTECEAGKTYGRHGDEIWVSNKCGGKFEICYRQGIWNIKQYILKQSNQFSEDFMDYFFASATKYLLSWNTNINIFS